MTNATNEYPHRIAESASIALAEGGGPMTGNGHLDLWPVCTVDGAGLVMVASAPPGASATSAVVRCPDCGREWVIHVVMLPAEEARRRADGSDHRAAVKREQRRRARERGKS